MQALGHTLKEIIVHLNLKPFQLRIRLIRFALLPD
jgi:hypothetical protein